MRVPYITWELCEGLSAVAWFGPTGAPVDDELEAVHAPVSPRPVAGVFRFDAERGEWDRCIPGAPAAVQSGLESLWTGDLLIVRASTPATWTLPAGW